MEKILFYRDYKEFTGGHLKTFDYYNHIKSTSNFIPEIYFTPASLWDNQNPWIKEKNKVVRIWKPECAGMLFLAGFDWVALDEEQRRNKKPKINLIQGTRHGNEKDGRYQFLKYRAVRICVSREVAYAIKGLANGPVFTIEEGLDTSEFPETKEYNTKEIDVLILGLKNPKLARSLESKLKNGLKIRILTSFISRGAYIELLQNSKIIVCLPLEREGFYISPIEGMIADAIVICPNVPSLQRFGSDRVNCFIPEYNGKDILLAIKNALDMTELERKRMISSARQVKEFLNLKTEREDFLKIFNNINEIW